MLAYKKYVEVSPAARVGQLHLRLSKRPRRSNKKEHHVSAKYA